MLQHSRRRALLGSLLPAVALAALAAAPAGAAPLAFDSFAEPFGPETRSIAVADLNGDGYRDLAAAVDGHGMVKVALGDGDAEYGARKSYSLPDGGNPAGVTAADLDGDGDRDLAVTDDIQDAVVLLRNAGNGDFTVDETTLATDTDPVSVAAGDLNGDGRTDLVTANRAPGTASVLLNGAGGFAPAAGYATGEAPESVSLGDTDEDGDLDLAVANRVSNSVTVRRNGGNGAFGLALDLAVGSRPFGVTAADVDEDGDADLVASNWHGESVSVLRSQGNGAFAAPATYSAGAPRGVDVADIDGDGHVDLVIAGAGLSVRPGAGDGTFGAAASFSLPGAGLGVTVAHLDTDGRLDAVAATSGGAAVVVQPVAPSVLTGPQIHGAPQRNEIQYAGPGNWMGTRVAHTYQWLRCTDLYLRSCTPIETADAADDQYTPTADDSGRRLRVRDSVANGAGSATSTSAATKVIDAPTVRDAARVRAVTPRSGTEYWAYPAWFGGWQLQIAHAWLRCDGSGSNCVPIGTADATDDYDYTPTASDSGRMLRLRMTATNSLGTARSTTLPTRRVDAPAMTKSPTITGTARVGQSLHADPGSWSGPAPTYRYSWLRCSATGTGCTAIGTPAAAQQDYTPVAADAGHKLKVWVTATNDHGSASVNSAATRVIAPAS